MHNELKCLICKKKRTVEAYCEDCKEEIENDKKKRIYDEDERGNN